MTSLNDSINELFQAYLLAMGMEMPLNMAFERYLFQAIKEGVTALMMTDVVRERKQRITQGVRNRESLKLRNLIGDEEAIADFINEAAMIAALKRKKVVEVCRASVLRQSGRSDQIPSPEPRSAADVELVRKLREAAQ